MLRDGKFWLMVPLLWLWPLSASADDGEVAKVIAECGAADLPQASLDSCIERVRVLEETEPSPRLQTLEASLEQRESGRPVRARTAAPVAPPAAEVASEPYVSVQGSEQKESIYRSAEPDSSPSPSGSTFEDQPPVSDTDDVPSGADRQTDEDANDPPQA